MTGSARVSKFKRTSSSDESVVVYEEIDWDIKVIVDTRTGKEVTEQEFLDRLRKTQ